MDIYRKKPQQICYLLSQPIENSGTKIIDVQENILKDENKNPHISKHKYQNYSENVLTCKRERGMEKKRVGGNGERERERC